MSNKIGMSCVCIGKTETMPTAKITQLLTLVYFSIERIPSNSVIYFQVSSFISIPFYFSDHSGVY